MTYGITLDKLRKLKAQKTVVSDELRKRDQPNDEETSGNTEEEIKVSSQQPTVSTATVPGVTP